MSDTESLRLQLTRSRTRREPPVKNKDLLSTGSTLLNLAMSDRARGGMSKGRYYFLVGDSASGKTFLTLTCFAEASLNPNFAKHRFIHDNAEDGALMDVGRFFGKAVNERVEPPAGTRDAPAYSSTIEDFYYHIDDAFERGEPFIYVLDSMDALSSGDDRDKFRKRKKAHRAGREESGSYGLAKAKANSAGMREVIARLKGSESILIVISQSRDAIGFASMFNEKTRAGGRALKFYAHCEVWTSVAGAMKVKVRGKTRRQGIRVLAKVEKNRQTGRNVSVKVPIYWSTGIDDTGSMVDFLVEEGHWRKAGGRINAKELGLALPREELIQAVERDGLEPQLKAATADVWEQIKQATAPVRKNRYTQ